MSKLKLIPHLLLSSASLFLFSISYTQTSLSLREFIFPSDIIRSEFIYMNSNSRVLENSKMTYEYLFDQRSAIVFISNKENGTILSRRKEEYIITDSAIYLFNVNTKDILAYKRENFLGYTNCFLKIPKRGKEITYTYKDETTTYSCKSKLTQRMISDSVYTVLEVEKTPFENGKYISNLKTVMVYVQGKGLYEEYLYSNRNTIYKLKSFARKAN